MKASDLLLGPCHCLTYCFHSLSIWWNLSVTLSGFVWTYFYMFTQIIFKFKVFLNLIDTINELCVNIFLDDGFNFFDRHSISGPKKLSSCWVVGIKFFIILPYSNVLSPHLSEILAILSSLSLFLALLTFLFSIVVNYFIDSRSSVFFLVHWVCFSNF